MTGSWEALIQFVTSVISGVCIPVMLYMIGANRRERNEQLEHLDQKLFHLDECLDDLKVKFGSRAATREDLSGFRSEVQQMLTRQRESISNDTNGLHDRLMRLENVHFRGDQA